MKLIKYIILQVVSVFSFALLLSCEEEPLVHPGLPSYEEPEPEAIDLGLPSGVKWASFNVGARAPEGYGGLYAWGETDAKLHYSWDTYKWGNDRRHMTKYSRDVDNKDFLDLEDDPANVHWGGDWRMPTREEQQELMDNCSWELTNLKGTSGYKVTGSNGNSIFLPLAGVKGGSSIVNRDLYGYYWSTSMYGYHIFDYSRAYYLALRCDSGALGGYYSPGENERYVGHSVRAVCGGNVPVRYKVSVSSAGNGSVTIGDFELTEVFFKPGSYIFVDAEPDDGYNFAGWFVGEADEPVSIEEWYKFTVNEDVSLVAKFEAKKCINGHEYVDLGLPSGLKWAVCNIGGANPKDYSGWGYNLGQFFAWGETESKTIFGWEEYKWCQGRVNTLTKYCTVSGNGTVDNKTELDPEDDAARVAWGGTWRMPRYEELQELIDNCTWTVTDIFGWKCYKVASKTNKYCIYLPFTGIAGKDDEECGCFLSTSIYGGGYYVKCLYFNEEKPSLHYTSRSYGYMVRPVSD